MKVNQEQTNNTALKTTHLKANKEETHDMSLKLHL